MKLNELIIFTYKNPYRGLELRELNPDQVDDLGYEILQTLLDHCGIELSQQTIEKRAHEVWDRIDEENGQSWKNLWNHIAHLDSVGVIAKIDEKYYLGGVVANYETNQLIGSWEENPATSILKNSKGNFSAGKPSFVQAWMEVWNCMLGHKG